MAKLLTEEEHAALVEDRERLEWMINNCVDTFPEENQLAHFPIGHREDRPEYYDAPTMREAIDKARGVVK